MAEAAPRIEARDSALKRELGLRDVALFGITCICGARWIAPAARAGAVSLLVWVFAAAFFAVPLAIAIATLAAKYPRSGGFYWWTRADFGPWHGFLCFWTYWIGNAFWFPSAAMFYVSMAASALGPGAAQIADSRIWLVIASLCVLWIALGANLVGIVSGKWTENIGALAAQTLAILLGAAAVLVFMRHGSAGSFAASPGLSWRSIGFWATIAYAMSGMELVGLMSGEIRNPERVIPRAAVIASAFSTLFYVAATASVLVLLSPDQVSELTGLAHAAGRAGALLHARWLETATALLVLISAIGQFGGIGAATSRLPFALGVDHMLPAAFGRLHPRWRTPYVSMLALGALSSTILIAIQFGDTARAAYDTMVSLMVIGGFLPYVYIFGSAWLAGRRASAACGLAITALAILSSAIPTDSIGNIWLFEAKILGGTALMVLSALLVYKRAKRYSV